jgi:hypothetical protein
MEAIFERNKDDLVICRLYLKGLLAIQSFLGFGGIYGFVLEDAPAMRQLEKAYAVLELIEKKFKVKVYEHASVFFSFAGPLGENKWNEFFLNIRRVIKKEVNPL